MWLWSKRPELSALQMYGYYRGFIRIFLCLLCWKKVVVKSTKLLFLQVHFTQNLKKLVVFSNFFNCRKAVIWEWLSFLNELFNVYNIGLCDLKLCLQTFVNTYSSAGVFISKEILCVYKNWEHWVWGNSGLMIVQETTLFSDILL